MSTTSKRPRHEEEEEDDEDEEEELSSDEEETEQDGGDADKKGAPASSSSSSSMPRPDSSNSLGGGGATLPAPSSSKLSYALVCSSNMNRSMEAHAAFLNAGFTKVASLGTGRMVRLPAATAEGQVSFVFGTPYTEILKELEGQAEADAKLQEFYRRTKLLDILRRNARIKTAPERLQNIEELTYDVIVCFDIRVYDAVQEDLQVCQEVAPCLPLSLLPSLLQVALPPSSAPSAFIQRTTQSLTNITSFLPFLSFIKTVPRGQGPGADLCHLY
jgi:RNA polymerase II subunit A C-terminal domain phosphatase SSU72